MAGQLFHDHVGNSLAYFDILAPYFNNSAWWDARCVAVFITRCKRTDLYKI
jgi:hypothetical protein